jgi:hypothetical protein
VITSRENGNEYDIQGEFTPSIAGSKIWSFIELDISFRLTYVH